MSNFYLNQGSHGKDSRRQSRLSISKPSGNSNKLDKSDVRRDILMMSKKSRQTEGQDTVLVDDGKKKAETLRDIKKYKYFIVLPDDPFKIKWEYFMTIPLIFVFFMTPYRLAFV